MNKAIHMAHYDQLRVKIVLREHGNEYPHVLYLYHIPEVAIVGNLAFLRHIDRHDIVEVTAANLWLPK